MPKYVEGVELTQEGMHAIFARMGHAITSGKVYNGVPEIDKAALDRQGFMPVLTGVGPNRTSGHWIMLMKGGDNQYYLFDPLGKASGDSYKSILAKQVPGATLSVIPNAPGLNMGLCGYWVASAGLRAHAALNTVAPPDLATLGQTITDEMRHELTGAGYGQITGWLRAVGEAFPVGDPTIDAKALREATEKELHIAVPEPVSLGKTTGPTEVSVQPTAPQKTTVSAWNGFSLYTDETIRAAAQYAYTNYLGTAYTGPVESAPVNMHGKTVYRQVHGLAHTLRTMAYAEVIVEEARKAQLRGEPLAKFKDGRTIADVTPEELKKIMIAQAFFVAGRDDEESALNYARYHEQSKTAFLAYVKANEATLIPEVYKDQAEVYFYAAVIEDKNHSWGESPAHFLVNQCHMVDLMRVKQPPESYLEHYFRSLKPWVGSKGAEAVFAIQRQFFHATHEVVSGFDGAPYVKGPQRDDHIVLSAPGQFRFVRGADGEALRHPIKLGEKQGALKFFPATYKLQAGEKFEFTNGSLGRYVIGEDGQPIRNPLGKGETVGSLAFFAQNYELQGTERWMRVDEFLQQDEVQKRFPGAGKILEGGKPGLNMMQYDAYVNSRERADCETNVDYCLGQLQAAHDKARIDPLKAAFQSSPAKGRRQANVDEIAAANIIQQIMDNPAVIQADQVLINGERLDEKFFRGLLAKCDMAVVGSLLNDTDVGNLDALMLQERNTDFHSTSAEALPVKIGAKWEELRGARRGGVTQLKHDLIYLMQKDAWYFTRVNAIAQNRDKDSTFKEVVLTTLLTSLTNKALVDTSRAPAPKKLFRGLDFSDDFKNKLISQANAMIANTTEHLFTDASPETFKQIKLNDFSQISAKTCASTTTNIELCRTIWDSNTIFEMLDPDGLLHPKQVGNHEVGSEMEFSMYLPEDVALIPVKVTLDGKTGTGKDRHIFTFVAVKSPDFIPRYESGFAVEPFMRIQTAKVEALKTALEQAREEVNVNSIIEFQDVSMATRYAGHLPLAYKNFIKDTVAPVMERCLTALMDNNADNLAKALAALPADPQWSVFNFAEAREAKSMVDAIKVLIEKKVVLEGQILPALDRCQAALQKHNVDEASLALKSLPLDKDMGCISGALRGQIQRIRDEVTASLRALEGAVSAPVVVNAEKMRVRYEALYADITKRITDFAKVKPDNLVSYNKANSDFNAFKEELKLLRNEKIRMNIDPRKAVDFADVEALEKQLQEVQVQFSPALLQATTNNIAALLNEKPKSKSALKSIISQFNERLAEIELLRGERIKAHGSSKDPLDVGDLDSLMDRLQPVNQSVVANMINTVRVSLLQMQRTTFHEQEKEIQGDLEILAGLEKTLDKSETAEKHKESILKLRTMLTEKQEAYPHMVQVHLKGEMLLTQLRQMCGTHHAHLADLRKTRLQEIQREDDNGGLLRNVGYVLWGVTNYMSFTVDERLQIRKQEQTLAQFKSELGNDKIDSDQLIAALSNKSAAELQEGLGVSLEIAQDLKHLFKTMDKSTNFLEKLEKRSELIDDILVKIEKDQEVEFVVVNAEESGAENVVRF